MNCLYSSGGGRSSTGWKEYLDSKSSGKQGYTRTVLYLPIKEIYTSILHKWNALFAFEKVFYEAAEGVF